MAGSLSPLLRRGRALALGRLALAALGWVLIARAYEGPALAEWMPQAALLSGLAAALALLWPAGASPTEVPDVSPRPAEAPWRSRATAGASIALAAALAASAGLVPRPIDTFHDGEILASAVDLASGGRPFETLIWPHGAHDTGLTAMWLAVLGKTGSSPLAFARATTGALGAIALYLLCRATLGAGPASLAGLGLLAGSLASDGPALALELGTGLFVVLAHSLLVRRGRFALLLSGAALGLGHLFRIEVGLYALAAALAVLAFRHARGAGSAGRRALRMLRDVALVGAGIAGALLACRVVAGWPGSAWFDYVFRVMPRFHRDATGLPFPLPIAGAPRVGDVDVTAAVARLLVPLVLAAAAVERGAALLRRRGPVPASRRLESLVFFAVFAAAATRSALGRSDAGHLEKWNGLPLWAALLLLVGLAASRWRWSRPAVVGAVILGALCVRPAALALGLPAVASNPLTALAAAPGRARAHWRPNSPAGECADAFLAPPELEVEANRSLLRDTCALETALKARGVRRLVVDHAAPWLNVRLGMAFPSRYYAARRAVTLEQQREFVTALREYEPDAVLRVRGYRSLPQYDVDDAMRTPVIAAYESARQYGAPVVETPLGELVLWKERPVERPWGRVAGSGIVFQADEVVLQPDTGFVVARGWAADVAGRRLLGGILGERGEVETGVERLDVARALGGDWAAGAGWRWVFRSRPGQRGAAVLLQLADGGWVARGIDLRSARRLPPLPVWRGIGPLLDGVEREAYWDRAVARNAEP